MKNSGTGEFEMAVGSRHFLGGLFLVLLLVGVAFSVGYVVGENAHSAQAEAATQPALPSSRPQHAASPPPEPARQLPPDANAAAGAAPAVAREATSPVAPPQAAPPSASAPVAEAVPGSYWQVKALRKSGAEVMVQTLKDKGLPAVMSPSPGKPGVMRVLVGPYDDSETMGHVKSQLEKAGLHPFRNNLK